jgi:hypothetical protein
LVGIDKLIGTEENQKQQLKGKAKSYNFKQPLQAALAAETVLSSMLLWKVENGGDVIGSPDMIQTNYAVCPEQVLRSCRTQFGLAFAVTQRLLPDSFYDASTPICADLDLPGTGTSFSLKTC